MALFTAKKPSSILPAFYLFTEQIRHCLAKAANPILNHCEILPAKWLLKMLLQQADLSIIIHTYSFSKPEDIFEKKLNEAFGFLHEI